MTWGVHPPYPKEKRLERAITRSKNPRRLRVGIRPVRHDRRRASRSSSIDRDVWSVVPSDKKALLDDLTAKVVRCGHQGGLLRVTGAPGFGSDTGRGVRHQLGLGEFVVSRGGMRQVGNARGVARHVLINGHPAD